MAEIPGDVRSLLEGRNFAHIATLQPDGSPASVAVWAGVEGDSVVFFTQDSSQKARNLRRDPRVALSIVDRENPYRTAWLRGRVTRVVEGDDARPTIDAIATRYTGQPFPMPTGTVFVIEPERVGTMALPFSEPQ
jgi:PPOX class probable F420-dependent enzyme